MRILGTASEGANLEMSWNVDKVFRPHCSFCNMKTGTVDGVSDSEDNEAVVVLVLTMLFESGEVVLISP